MQVLGRGRSPRTWVLVKDRDKKLLDNAAADLTAISGQNR